AGFQLLHRFEEEPCVVVGDVGVFTSRIYVHAQADIDTGLHEAMCQSTRPAEQIDGIDLPAWRRSDFSLCSVFHFFESLPTSSLGESADAPPAFTHSSTSSFLNFQRRPMRCAGISCLSIHLYTVSLLTPRYLQISLIDNQRSSISAISQAPRGRLAIG